MIARLASFDVLRMDRIYESVRLRDGLHAYVELSKDDAAVEFRHQQTLYAQGSLKKAPKKPPILKARARRRSNGKPFVVPTKPAFLDALED